MRDRDYEREAAKPLVLGRSRCTGATKGVAGGTEVGNVRTCHPFPALVLDEERDHPIRSLSSLDSGSLVSITQDILSTRIGAVRPGSNAVVTTTAR